MDGKALDGPKVNSNDLMNPKIDAFFMFFYWPTTNILQYVKIIYTLQTNYITHILDILPFLTLSMTIIVLKNGFHLISFTKYGWAGCIGYLIQKGCSFYVTIYGFVIFFANFIGANF